jgi:hypothetical protein
MQLRSPLGPCPSVTKLPPTFASRGRAFGGYELVMRAYAEAIDRGYRFYSYGDAMLLV